MDIQVRLKNGRLQEEEMDRLHAELRDILTQFRSAYAEQVMRGPQALRPSNR